MRQRERDLGGTIIFFMFFRRLVHIISYSSAIIDLE